MGRRRGGGLGRTVQASLKITAVEKEILRSRYGTEGSGLRVAVDQLLHTEKAETPTTRRPTKKRSRPRTNPEAEPPIPDEVLATMEPLVPDGLDIEAAANPGSSPAWAQPATTPAAGHRHRRGEKLGELFDHGTPITTWRCSHPGCTVTLT